MKDFKGGFFVFGFVFLVVLFGGFSLCFSVGFGLGFWLVLGLFCS